MLRKFIALYFRFSLLDKSFNIYVDNEKITYKDIKDLADKTEFLWRINNLDDPYIHKELKKLKELRRKKIGGNIKGFIASVSKPKDLNIFNIDERVSVDLFVNGRLRDKNILRHIPTARIVENYIYGQIHFDKLDGKELDRFTTSREGVVADDAMYQDFLRSISEVLKIVIEDWDEWRNKWREDGDPDNERITKKERKSRELFNVVSEEYIPHKGSPNKKKIDNWIDELLNDAQFNFSSYAECFISENLIRNYIRDKNIDLSPEAGKKIDEMKKVEKESKGRGNISIDIRRKHTALSYLDMSSLANLVDKTKDPNKQAALSRDAKEYKPIRDALAHTALLTDVAKSKLTSVYENIKGRIKTLLS